MIFQSKYKEDTTELNLSTNLSNNLFNSVDWKNMYQFNTNIPLPPKEKYQQPGTREGRFP